MKYSIPVKFLAIFLAAVLLAAVAASGLGILGLLNAGLYERTLENVYSETLESKCHSLAVELVHRYASRELGKLPESYLEYYYPYNNLTQFQEGKYFYTLRDANGDILESNLTGKAVSEWSFDFDVTNMNYRVFASSTILADSTTSATGSDNSNGIDWREDSGNDEDSTYTDMYYDYDTKTTRILTYTLGRLEYCFVTVYLLEGAVADESWWGPLGIAYDLRYDLFWIFGVSLLLFALCAVYLCCAAGRKKGQEPVCAGGLNRLPLDLYLACGIGVEALLVLIFSEAVDLIIQDTQIMAAIWLCGLLLVLGCLVFVGFCFAFVAQIKMKEAFWWRNSLVGRVCRRLGRFLGRCFRGGKRLLEMLPDMWQLAVIAAGMGLILIITLLFAYGNSYIRVNGFFAWILILEICAVIGGVAYCLYAFGVLKKGAQNMAQGDLHRLVPTAHLVGPFKIFAWQLNRLSGAARRAAEEQMRSERMKTELITNVSHDIKTPLTSIINYVDLLEKPHSEEETTEYLGVLSRQSQRLKKLIEDLMEMSKASSGTMAVELTRLDAGESLRQALGEFSDKLEAAGMSAVVTIPETPVYALADGRHTWRVLSNLLGNVVKYALPGTRVYIDLIATGENVVISMKNISREELNISADELTERFVRGDASRNTEGSGLGLNIAQSLMELQKGTLEITVDGDLFKATLIFQNA